VKQAQTLLELARPMNVTFHRAFDMCREPERALEELITLGVNRVLTSGQEASCLEGLDLIARLQKQAAGRIIILPGGGITPRNVERIVAGTGVTEVHLSARTTVQSRMQHQNTRCFMGGALRPPEFSWKKTDQSAVHAVVSKLKSI
jgi:copper homeostasis protein